MKLKTQKVNVGGQELEVAEVREGKPVYLDDKGNETLGDLPSAIEKLKAAATEREASKTTIAELTAKLTPWTEIGEADPAKVKTALETLGQVEKGKLVNAQEQQTHIKREVDSAVDAMKKDYDARIRAAERTAAEATAKARATGIRSLFAELIQAKGADGKPLYAIGLSTADRLLGPHFVEEEGVWRAYADPETRKRPILSQDPARIMEPALPDEAFRYLIENHPDKDHFFPGVGATGSGNQPSGFGGRGGNRMTRAQFNALSPSEQREFAVEKKGTVVDASAN